MPAPNPSGRRSADDPETAAGMKDRRKAGSALKKETNFAYLMIDFTDEICYDTKACADEEDLFHDFEEC